MSTGGKDLPSAGFTIVEVMVVLAVSSLLAVSAFALINGRQRRAQFTTSINDTKQQLQQIINETLSGYFPASDQFVCQDTGDQKPVLFNNGSGGQGTNQGCVFLGKAIQFGLDVTDPGNTQLGVIPIVGRQYWNNAPATTLAHAIPRAAWPEGTDPVSGTAAAALQQLSNNSEHTIQYGLHIADNNSACHNAHVPGGPGVPILPPPAVEAPPIHAFGIDPPACFLPTGKADTATNYVATGMAAILFGDSSGNISSLDSSSDLQSGAQQMSLYGVGPNKSNGTNTSNSAGDPISTATAHIGNVPMFSTATGSQGNLISASKLLVCVADDSTNQSGLFTISGDGSFNVTLSMLSNTTCS